MAGPRIRRRSGREGPQRAVPQRSGQPEPGPARAFYSAVFDFTLDGNPGLSGLDFTFRRRPDRHEIGRRRVRVTEQGVLDSEHSFEQREYGLDPDDPRQAATCPRSVAPNAAGVGRRSAPDERPSRAGGAHGVSIHPGSLTVGLAGAGRADEDVLLRGDEVQGAEVRN
jgi:hypothetical protein